MNSYDFRKKLTTNEMDYLALQEALSGYRCPRAKITQLLNKNIITRVKKGIYVFSPDYVDGLVSKEFLANIIYGPSAISLEYALSFYGLIPERTYTITSVTLSRNKFFETPLGGYSYQYLHPKKYSVGIDLVKIADKNILMGTPEKALIDKIYFTKGLVVQDLSEIELLLFESFRIDEQELKQLSIKQCASIASVYRNKNIFILLKFLEKLNA